MGGGGSRAKATRELAAIGRRRGRQRTRSAARRRARPGFAAAAIETVALLGAALIAAIAVLGRLADWFAGTGLWLHLLPFAGGVLGLGVLLGAVLHVWLRLRAALARRRLRVLLTVFALGVAGLATWWTTRPPFRIAVASLEALVGGGPEAERQALAHQVYAEYRRTDPETLQRLLHRALVYAPAVNEAAAAAGVDAEILMGVGAVESAFRPRDSRDGGRGLFQITAVPPAVLEDARRRLHVARLDLDDPRQNAFVAAATLRHYLIQMRGDLFLGLLAYNIGPRNGGLLSIMQQYGARDFITIQPYLQHLPRDYPVRVLAAALAYRLWNREGRLPRYEEGDNARRIQGIGIPGLAPDAAIPRELRGRR